MQKSRIAIEEKRSPQQVKQDRMWTGEPEEALVDGCNFFTGRLRDSGSISMSSNKQEDWEQGWRMIGVDPPGALPAGAIFVLHTRHEPGLQPDVSVTAARGYGEYIVKWDVALKTQPDLGMYGCFYVLVFPGCGVFPSQMHDINEETRDHPDMDREEQAKFRLRASRGQLPVTKAVKAIKPAQIRPRKLP